MTDSYAAGSAFSMTLRRHSNRAMTALVRGDLDIAASPTLESQLAESIGEGMRHIVVDLSGATCLDSTGLTSLLNVQRRLAEQAGTLHIVCTNVRIAKVFEITGLMRVLSVVTKNPLDDTSLAS